MSKTIEIISIHKGPIAITTRGESRTVQFEAKGDVGIAMCDHDEAAVFLKIGLPGYWKAGAKTEAATEVVEAAVAELEGEAAEQAETIKRGRRKAE